MNELMDSLLSPVDMDIQQENTDPGLYHGHSGMAIVLYLLAKHTRDAAILASAEEMLDKITDGIGSVSSTTFGYGLAGIGWTVEWLVQHKLLTGVNTDEVLSDIDDVIYNDIAGSREESVSLMQGAMGKAVYFIKRGLSKNPGTSRYAHIAHQESLVMLTDDIDELFRGEDGVLSGTPFANDRFTGAEVRDLLNVATYILLISRYIRVNQPVIEDTLYTSAYYIDACLERICQGAIADQLVKHDRPAYYAVFYSAVCYLITGKMHGHLHWQQQARHYIQQLRVYDGDITGEEELFSRLIIYTLLHIHLPEEGYDATVGQILSILRDRSVPASLHNGRGALTLAQLSLADVTLVDHWHELFFINY